MRSSSKQAALGFQWMCSLSSPWFTILMLSFHILGRNWTFNPKFRFYPGMVDREGGKLAASFYRWDRHPHTTFLFTPNWFDLSHLFYGAAREAGRCRLCLGGLVTNSHKGDSMIKARDVDGQCLPIVQAPALGRPLGAWCLCNFVTL